VTSIRKTRAGSIGLSAVVVESLEGRQLFAVGLSSLQMVGDGAPAAASLTQLPSENQAALSTTLYDSSGFESPRYTPGPLNNQDAAQGPWLKSGDSTAAVVQTLVSAHGTQAVRMDRHAGLTARFAPVHTISAVDQTITIDWSMRVDAATGVQPYGPFFGVEAYHDPGNGVLRLIGSGGIDAKTGEILFQYAGSGALDSTGVTVTLGQFHSFRLVLDFPAQQYSFYVDQVLARNEGFVDSTLANPINGFSLASLSTFAAGGDAASQSATGTAYFDDYLITSATAAVTPPKASTLTVNDGTVQRSKVSSLTVKFDKAVTLGTGAFSLSRLNTGGSGLNDGSAPTDATAALGTPTSSDGGTTWLVPLNGTGPFIETNPDSTPAGSIVDGIYKLNIDPTKVTAGGVAMAAPASFTFYRLFGDVNGDTTVNPLDYAQFRNSFSKNVGDAAYNPVFDFNNDGAVNPLDYARFRSRFGKELIL